ncbi:hypothetical protein GCM10027406_06660 [Leifsonia lichenia]
MGVTDASTPHRGQSGVSPRTAFLLAQLGAAASDRFGERVSELGLTARDAGVLRVLGRTPGISQKDLAHRLGTVPSRLVALIDDLQARGLVERTRSEADRRNNQLALTADGERMLEELRVVAEAHQADVLAPLDPREQQAFAALLGKLAGASGLSADGHPGYRRT